MNLILEHYILSLLAENLKRNKIDYSINLKRNKISCKHDDIQVIINGNEIIIKETSQGEPDTLLRFNKKDNVTDIFNLIAYGG